MFVLAICATACSTVRSAKSSDAGLKVLTRAEWGANPTVAEMKTQSVSRITIHHTATLQKPDRSLVDKMRALQKFSQNPGALGNGKIKPAWPDVPYHFYVDCHGEIAEGRDVRYVGDTNTAYDPTGHLLVVLEGNFEEEQVGQRQLETLKRFIAMVKERHQIGPDSVGSHKEFAETLCPGKNLQMLLTEIREHAAGR